MTGYLRILPALPLSMAYIDSISIAELVHNVKKKKRKERLQNKSKEELHSYCLHFLELVMMCEKSRYFTITSTKVQATGSLIEADERVEKIFLTSYGMLNQALGLLFLTKLPSMPLWRVLLITQICNPSITYC